MPLVTSIRCRDDGQKFPIPNNEVVPCATPHTHECVPGTTWHAELEAFCARGTRPCEKRRTHVELWSLATRAFDHGHHSTPSRPVHWTRRLSVSDGATFGPGARGTWPEFWWQQRRYVDQTRQPWNHRPTLKGSRMAETPPNPVARGGIPPRESPHRQSTGYAFVFHEKRPANRGVTPVFGFAPVP